MCFVLCNGVGWGGHPLWKKVALEACSFALKRCCDFEHGEMTLNHRLCTFPTLGPPPDGC